MMRLTVEGVRCPLDEGATLALGYDAAALSDVGSGRSGARVALSVPRTPQTAALFGDADNPLTAVRFNTAARRAVLTVDDSEIFTGNLFLKRVRHAGGAAFYEVEIVGDTALWARTAALRRVSDAGVAYEGTLTVADVRSSWTDGKPVTFLPVYRDSYDSQSTSESLLPPQRVLTTDDYHPFLSVAEVVRAIFADAGYTVESRFMESEFFRSLRMSGNYRTSDTSARRRAMDFRAGRTDDAAAVANYFGRVYASAAVDASSVGNIVDTVEEYVADGEGRSRASGFYSNNRCFTVADNGVATFRPPAAVNVGFEYAIAYVTDHEIESRTRLKGFDTVHLGNGVTVPFTIANRYVDYRDGVRPGFAYKLTIFEPRAGWRYRLMGLRDGEEFVFAETTERMTSVTIPAAGTVTDLRLSCASNATGAFVPSPEDWAMYAGHVELTGRTEIEMTVRTPAEQLSPSAPKEFDRIYFEGADAGMNFTLLKRTTVRPLFSAAPGYGSRLTFADVAGDVRQITLLEALQRMFALQFCTDERTKTVRIEPYDDFFAGPEVDWRARVDTAGETLLADPSAELHARTMLGYADGDGAAARFDAANGGHFGRWSFDTQSKVAVEGEGAELNPLFVPTLSRNGVYDDAGSAWVMQVSDRDDEGDGSVAPRIVRYAGLHPLAGGERWSSPHDEGSYPLAAFHFAGDDHAEPFTLCFENRDGAEGLHTMHERRLHEADEGTLVTLGIRILPDEMAGLLACRDNCPSVRSRYRLAVGGGEALYTLAAVEAYDPAKATVRCRFRKIIPRQ